MESKLIELEDRFRRNNIIVFGVVEQNDETAEDLAEKVVLTASSERPLA